MTRVWIPLLLILGVLTASSCAQATPTPTVFSTPSPTPANTGELVVTAFAYSPPKTTTKLVVTAKNIEVKLRGKYESEDQWIKIIDSPPDFDLAAPGMQYELARIRIPAGDYIETRFTVQKIVVVLDGQDTEVPLTAQAYRLTTPFGVASGETTVSSVNFIVDNFEAVRVGNAIQIKPTYAPLFARLLVSRQPAATLWPTPTLVYW